MATQKNKSPIKSTNINKNINRNGNSRKNKSTKKNQVENISSDKNKLYLLPIAFIVIVLPLIMKLHEYTTPLAKFPWFSYTDQYVDFFLYYKQWSFIGISIILILIIAYKAYLNKNILKLTPVFLPLGAYALLALLSSLFSDYRNISFSGSFGQFESVFVLLGYCLVTYYVFLFVQTEENIKFIIYCIIIGALLMGFIGLTQYLGRDFFSTKVGLRLITPRTYWNSLDSIKFNFEANRVYATLYNPNYVGVYAALILPILLLLAIFSRKLWHSILFVLAILAVSICLIGSKSTTGIIAIALSLLLALILSWRYIIKYFYFTVPAILFFILSTVLFNNKLDDYLIKQFNEIFDIRKSEYSLCNIETLDDEVVISYKGSTLSTTFNVLEDGTFDIQVIDSYNNKLSLTTDPTTGLLIFEETKFSGIKFSPTFIDNKLGFNINIDGKDWTFTNQTDDETFYYLNQFGRLDKIITAPSSFFTGYESYASGRGYIWSRTIPLLKDNFILGSGADTYAIEFPQQDYVNLYNSGYDDQVLTKPHNLYLQIGVQTGTLSLFAFLIFYTIYFISSFKLYIRSKYDSFYSKIGVAVLIGTFSYMIAGLANDSSITVAPLFWVIIGLGITVNEKEKLLRKS